jgi:hypothetical protein
MRNAGRWVGAVAMVLASACGPLPEGEHDDGAAEGEIAPPFVPGANAKEDSASYQAIVAEQSYYATQVWEVKNQWEDRTTAEAKKAGLAWGESSGLSWNEKYQAWVKSLRRLRGVDGWYDTFEVTAPYGKTLPAPVLECAEVAMFLRITFASWYNLPFFMEATDSQGRRTFLGHFGWRTASGRYGTSALFKTAYKDYTGRDIARDGWPTDSALRGKKLAGANDDQQPFLGASARFGTYLDELFLNKRVGHFLLNVLDYFGSINLAGGTNTYNLKAAAVKDGDVLVERWQRNGIGHTLVVKSVDPIDGGRLTVDLVSGSMPRRQPKWEESAVAKSYFTSEYAGGPAMSGDNVPYSRLGGGLKRWRVAKKVNGYWVNTMMSADTSSWINTTSYAALEARLVEFANLLGTPDPVALRDALLRGIEDRRLHLSRKPASCAARQVREQLFRDLYRVMQESFGLSRAEVDRRYRRLDDYVFAELDYARSKTCCWNSTTAEMYQIIVDYARSQQPSNACVPPPVFKAVAGGYAAFKSYAAATGRSADWREWTEDESCPQRSVTNDTETAHDAAPYCDVLGPGAGGCVEDRFAGNHSRAAARAVTPQIYNDLRICSGVDDWFKVTLAAGSTLRIDVRFRHANGDVDLYLYNSAGTVVGRSEGTTDLETVTASTAGDYTVRVFGYNGAANTYSLEVAY